MCCVNPGIRSGFMRSTPLRTSLIGGIEDPRGLAGFDNANKLQPTWVIESW